jgi:hypothetical protein
VIFGETFFYWGPTPISGQSLRPRVCLYAPARPDKARPSGSISLRSPH